MGLIIENNYFFASYGFVFVSPASCKPHPNLLEAHFVHKIRIYSDKFVKPYALELKISNPQMLKAIIASKKKNERVDSQKIADLLRCNLLPECYISSEKIQELWCIVLPQSHGS